LKKARKITGETWVRQERELNGKLLYERLKKEKVIQNERREWRI